MDFALAFDSTSPVPLHRQLYEELRRSILAGRLPPGQRVPSTRALAKLLGVSRTTATQCYEDLISEGYLQAAQGSGTFVCRHLPEELLRPAPARSEVTAGLSKRRGLRLSTYGAHIARNSLPKPTGKESAISFAYWRPDFKRLPLRTWGRIVARHCRSSNRALFDYTDDPFGHLPLREAIALYLARARAVECDASQVVIVGGSQRALDLLTRLLVDRNDTVAVEDPGYIGARQIFLAQGAKLAPVPVDGSGIISARLKSRARSKIRLLYITPSHQFPTGVSLPLPRRLELLDWARRQGVMIIEDDFDSEYRYGGRPVPALQGLDRSGSVIYVGTFSKVLFPSLRIGYMVVPAALKRAIACAKWLTDRQAPMLDQFVLADFINEGHLERHIRRMRTLYEGRRGALVQALSWHFGERVSILGESAGMHLMARLQTKFDDGEVIKRAALAGVELVSARPYYLRCGRTDEFILGYAALSERRIWDGVRRLAQAIS